MSSERVDPQGVIDRLERAHPGGAAGLAFDADGTLWSGDVGEDVYAYACRHELIRYESAEPLAREARAHGLDAEGPPWAVAAALFQGYRRGIVDERRVCEIMAWGYAGYSLAELGALARTALTEARIEERGRRELGPVLGWARDNALRIVVISASPRIVVEEALSLAGIEVSAIAAATPRAAGGHILPELDEPLPYAEQKVESGQKLLAGHEWLGSFGDNVFDLQMLKRARVSVAVFPKAALRARLSELPGVVVLE